MPSCGGEETGWTLDSPRTHSSRAQGLETRVARNIEQLLRDYQHFILILIAVKKYDKEYLIHYTYLIHISLLNLPTVHILEVSIKRVYDKLLCRWNKSLGIISLLY